MPIRARSHILEEQSIRTFIDALPPHWVYRSKSPDYGIDGEVEIYNDDGSATGLTFHVQLRGTDNVAHADRVRLKVGQLKYFLSFDVPTAVVRYDSSDASFNWQWAANIASHANIREQQKSFTYRFGEKERWNDATPLEIRRTLEVRRRLAAYPPSMAVPLRVDLSAIPPVDRYPIDRAIARAIADSNGALIRANSTPADVEAFARLEPALLAVGIDTFTGVTFDLCDPTADVYLASILYALVRLFRRQRLIRQAEALAILLVERGLAHHNDDLALEVCLALERDLPALVRLATINDLHEQKSVHYGALALTIAKAPQDEGLRRVAMETFFDASITAARATNPASEAAAHYSIGNFYRARNDRALAVAHYNRARKLRPAYLDTGYFLSELGGLLFLSSHYKASARAYWGAALKNTGDSNAIFLLADALLLAGFVAAAHSCFEQALAGCSAPHMLLEAELKIMICDNLIEEVGSVIVPRRRAEAGRALHADGHDTLAHLENLSHEIDALNPLARFNLGVTCSAEGDRHAALHHFLLCAIVQPHDIEAWANAVICTLSLGDEMLLLRIMSVAIHHMGTEAYDHLRGQLVAQSASPDMLAALDEVAMHLLEENERPGGDGFAIRLLDDDSYHSLTVSGLGTA